jgi:Tfp pilus assembly protein PilX
MTGSKLFRLFRAKRTPRGFALLVAIILSAVAAVITFALANLAYKSLVLSSDALQSQFAFYAADSALECGLMGDRADITFPYTTIVGTTTKLDCGTATMRFRASAYDGKTTLWTGTTNSGWFTVNTSPRGSTCARLTVYKTDKNATSIFAEGLNTTCANIADPRALERGIKAIYGY